MYVGRLITLYQNLHESLHEGVTTSGDFRPATSLIYLRTEHESVMGWVSLSPCLPFLPTPIANISICLIALVNSKFRIIFDCFTLIT